MALSRTARENLTNYINGLPDGTVLASASDDDIAYYEIVAAWRNDSTFDEDWVALYANGSPRRVGGKALVDLLTRIDPLKVSRIAFGALEALHGDDAPRIEAGQTYVRRSADDSFAVRVAQEEMGTAGGERLPLTFVSGDPLADVENILGDVDDESSTFTLLRDGSGRRVDLYSGRIVDHSEIENAREA